MTTERSLSIKPLSPELVEAASSFSCGVRRIDEYLRSGVALQENNLARLFVALDRETRAKVIGYYAFHNMHIAADTVPLPLGGKLRRDSVVGAVYLVMFAVDRKYQGKGVGRALFAHALRKAQRVSVDTGVWAVVLDALDDRAERFYRYFGFDTLVSGTRRLFLPISATG